MTMAERIDGRVMWRNAFQALAPSMRAASYSSRDTPCSAARRMSATIGVHSQMSTRTSEGMASWALATQIERGSPRLSRK